MSTPVRLKGPQHGDLNTHYDEDDTPTLVVKTDPLRRHSFRTERFRRIDDYSTSLAINGLSAGSSTIIWNGTGASDTGGDWSRSGDVGAESTAAAHSGTNGLDSQDWDGSDNIQFSPGSAFDLSPYSSLEFWIKPIQHPKGKDVRIEWRNGSRVGHQLMLQNYSPLTIGVWQKITIPISDFSPTNSITQLRFRSEKDNQRYYIDDVELVTSGGAGPHIFRASPAYDECWKVEEILFVMSAGPAGWETTDFGIINGGLTSLLLLRYLDTHSSDVHWSFTMKDNLELLGRLEVRNNIEFLDSARQVTAVLDLKRSPIWLHGSDALEVVVSDDLSSLTAFEAWVSGGILIK